MSDTSAPLASDGSGARTLQFAVYCLETTAGDYESAVSMLFDVPMSLAARRSLAKKAESQRSAANIGKQEES